MKEFRFVLPLLFALFALQAFSQNPTQTKMLVTKAAVPDYKFSVNTTWLSLVNFGNEATNTHHYELHAKFSITPKDKIGIKVATWKLFAPMGIPWGPYLMNESEFFPGRISEKGVGITYQRFLWKGLYASVEVLPLWKTYLNEKKNNLGSGFKLYTTYHLGYHLSLFKNRIFIEPQVHCNYWPVDSKGPEGFENLETKWKNNYFLFEPNLYIGIKF